MSKSTKSQAVTTLPQNKFEKASWRPVIVNHDYDYMHDLHTYEITVNADVEYSDERGSFWKREKVASEVWTLSSEDNLERAEFLKAAEDEGERLCEEIF